MRVLESAVQRMLDDVRKTHGWSQRRLAAELEVHHTTVSRWESGHVQPTPCLMRRLHELSGASHIRTAPSARQIRERRRHCGLTQFEFAARLGVTQSTLSKLETGTLRCTPEIAERLKTYGWEAGKSRQNGVDPFWALASFVQTSCALDWNGGDWVDFEGQILPLGR